MTEKIAKIRKDGDKLMDRNPLEIVADLNQMQATAGWATILEMIGENILTLNNMILEKTTTGREDGDQISDDEVDQLRAKRGYLNDLKNIPQNYIDKLEIEEEEEENFDPYYKSGKELVADRKK